MYLYRAIDSVGDTVEFWFSQRRDLLAAKRVFRKAIERHGPPKRIVIDSSQTKREAIIPYDMISRSQEQPRKALKPIRIRQSRHLNNRVEQDPYSLRNGSSANGDGNPTFWIWNPSPVPTFLTRNS